MALIKQKELPSGVSVEYWRIENLVMVPKIKDKDGSTVSKVQAAVQIYLNAAAREAGKEPALTATAELGTVEQFSQVNEAPLVRAYNLLKQNPDLAGAQDA